MSTYLIRNIQQLYQVEETPKKWVKGAAMQQLPSIENAYVLIENNRIADFGAMEQCPERADKVLDATGKSVLPCWCDSHTHIVYAASREGEFVDRIKGLSYEEIARRGGGILNSARCLQDAPEELLLEQAYNRLQEITRFGTGAVEIKSGYGLTYESELKMLRVIQKLKKRSKVTIKATFLGAHAIPQQFWNDRQQYIQLLINKMLPSIAEQQLADYVDVFCDKGFFTVAETDQILQAAANYGLTPKIHANELANSGGIQVGVKNGARSVDHLEHTGDAEIACLLASETMPTLLPSTAFFLNIPYAPARKMIDAGLPVALATDYNPGSTPSGRMAFVLSLACLKMKMLPEEVINAATINGAYAMEVQEELGSICKGKKANLLITKPLSSLAYLPYSFGSDLVDAVIVEGENV